MPAHRGNAENMGRYDQHGQIMCDIYDGDTRQVVSSTRTNYSTFDRMFIAQEEISISKAGEYYLLVSFTERNPFGNNRCFSAYKVSIPGTIRTSYGTPTTPTAPVLVTEAAGDVDNPNVTLGVKLSWVKVPGAEGYDVYRSKQGGEYELIASGVTANAYVDLNIKPSTTYSYVICPAGKGIADENASKAMTVTTGPEAAPLLPDANGEMGRANGYMIMQIDNPIMDVNGELQEMDIAPFLDNARTFLPLRFAALNLNCRATWINATMEILLVWNMGASTPSG